MDLKDPTYYPETYVAPCVEHPRAFDIAIQHSKAVNAIRVCRQLCAMCHPEHQTKCLANHPNALGVVAGLTLDQRQRLGLTGRGKGGRLPSG